MYKSFNETNEKIAYTNDKTDIIIDDSLIKNITDKTEKSVEFINYINYLINIEKIIIKKMENSLIIKEKEEKYNYEKYRKNNYK